MPCRRRGASWSGSGRAPGGVPPRAVGQRHRGQRADHRLGARRRGRRAARTARPRACERQRAVARHQRRPAARAAASPRSSMRLAARVSHAVGSPVPVQSNSSRKRERSGARRVGAVADRRAGRTLGLPVAPHPEERRALGRAEPLVAVAGVVGGAERAEIERHHPRRVGAVDQRVDAAAARARRRGAAIGSTRAGRAGHVIEQRQPRARRDRGQHRVHHLVGRRERKRDRRDHHPGPAARSAT